MKESKASEQVEYVNVYRVEKRGRGPYGMCSWSAGGLMSDHLPTPEMDAGLPEEVRDWDIGKYRFGAPTPEAMKEWIKYPSGLDRLGYRVSLYKANKKYVHSSDIQSMFIKRHAKKVKEWSVVDFVS